MPEATPAPGNAAQPPKPPGTTFNQAHQTQTLVVDGKKFVIDLHY
jgi:hypothetical protein